MKSVLSIIIIVLASTLCFSQKMIVALHAEHTIAGGQYGGSLSYETPAQLGTGLFYQADPRQNSETGVRNVYYGLKVQYPIVKTDRITFFATLRGGIVNKNYMVVIPGLETRINLGKRLGIAFGMSMRMSYPSISSTVICKLF